MKFGIAVFILQYVVSSVSIHDTLALLAGHHMLVTDSLIRLADI